MNEVNERLFLLVYTQNSITSPPKVASNLTTPTKEKAFPQSGQAFLFGENPSLLEVRDK